MCHEFGANQWWDEPARDFGLGLVPLGISIILWEYFLRKARSDEIIEYVNNELTNALSARLSKLNSLESHGLIAIRPGISNVELIEFIAKANRRLFILTPWLGFVEPNVLEQIFKEKASIKGFSLKAYSAASGSINILYVTGLAARAMVKSELKAA